MELTCHSTDSQSVYTVTHESAPVGFLVIDSTVAGRACGGLRMMPDVDELELSLLARDMTLKYGFLGLPQGGAKAGVRGDPEAPQEQRWALLEQFGQALAPLLRTRQYMPGTDMGTNNADIRHLMAAAGAPLYKRELRGTRSGFYTALTVFSTARQAARHLGLDLASCRAAVEGFGRVGGPLAGLLHEAGVRVVAISTSHGALYDPSGLDIPRLQTLATTAGHRVVEHYPDAERLDPPALLELPVELLSPCARHNSIREDNADRLQAPLVCPGANSPLTPGAEQALAARGVLCLPDFVANSGGVLGGTMEFAGLRERQIHDLVQRRFEPRVAELLQEAQRRGVLPRVVAEEVALRQFAEVQKQVAHPTPRGRVLDMGLALHRRGLFPIALVRAFAPRYFDQRLR